MGIETPTPTYINDLDANDPTPTDPLSQADDHIRNIKRAVKQTFSEVTGAVTATQGELNKLDGCTAATDNLNALTGITNIYDVVYPVGTIYETTETDNPDDLFPGTSWSVFGEGKVLVGLDPDDTDFDNINDTGGSKTVALTTAQMPQHNHSHNLAVTSVGNHTHGFTDYTFQESVSHGGVTNAGMGSGKGSGESDDDNYPARPRSATTGVGGGHGHGLTGGVQNKGSGHSHENMPPYVIVYRWKRDS